MSVSVSSEHAALCRMFFLKSRTTACVVFFASSVLPIYNNNYNGKNWFLPGSQSVPHGKAREEPAEPIVFTLYI